MRRDYLLLVVGWLRRWELCVGDGRLTAPVPQELLAFGLAVVLAAICGI
jgi:hypothetical protein